LSNQVTATAAPVPPNPTPAAAATEGGLADSFRRYFMLQPALDDALRHATYRIRHEVYCRDLGWEPVRPDGEETDAHDSHALPYIMQSVTNGNPVGCARLVTCRPDVERRLPIELACSAVFDRARFDSEAVDRNRIAEVSRLAVMRDYRRRKGEQSLPIAMDNEDFGDGNRARFPFIPVGLYLAAFAMAEDLGFDYLMVLTEPRLARHFEKLGIDIRQIGEGIEHRGLRVPYVIETAASIRNLDPLVTHLWHHVQASISTSLAGRPAAG